ncbi:hypothetical protein Areg01_05560 [Actinoplanes regularis]|nr:hypothetical protein Areg01_05560 [Actinoplanes regularis]
MRVVDPAAREHEDLSRFELDLQVGAIGLELLDQFPERLSIGRLVAAMRFVDDRPPDLPGLASCGLVDDADVLVPVVVEALGTGGGDERSDVAAVAGLLLDGSARGTGRSSGAG